jgi:hypothetical protein
MICATALRRLALMLAAGLAPAACGLNQEGVAPPNNTFFYPSTAILDDTGTWLYVANSNADLRYNDGTLVMVNVGATVTSPSAGTIQGAADDRAATWGPCPMGDYVNTPRSLDPNGAHYCCWDRIDVNILNCDERAYIPGNASVRIGSFAAGVARQERTCPTLARDQDGHPATCPNCTDLTNWPSGTPFPDDRLYLSVRGDTSLTFVDVSRVDAPDSVDPAPAFKCLESATQPTSGTFAVCNDAHRFTGHSPGLATLSPSANPPSIPLPNEPYALAIDYVAGLLFVGHLTGDTSHGFTGGYSVFDIAPTNAAATPDAPRFVAPFPSPFSANAGGLVGITTLSLANPDEDDIVFATSRYLPQVVGISTLADCPVGGLTRDVVASPNGELYSTSLVGSETRGIAFAAINTSAGEITKPFVLQRNPPALVGFDGTIPVSVLETCSSPTFLYKNTAGEGLGDRLFVNCYDTGEVYVFDPSVPRLEATFQVGRGPAGMVFPPVPPGEFPTVAYVVGFGDNNISVVDLQPGSYTEYHVIQRIGFPSEVPR